MNSNILRLYSYAFRRHVLFNAGGWLFMLRFIVAFLFLTIAAASVAQAPPAPAANMAAQIAEEKARADKAEHDLAIREAADQLEDAQTEQAYNRFEIWTGIMMGGFSVLVTLLVIMFGFRTEKAAAVAARQEVANAKAQIDALLAEAKKAAEAAVAAQTQAEATKAEVDELLKQSSVATTTARAPTSATPSPRSGRGNRPPVLGGVGRLPLGAVRLGEASARIAVPRQRTDHDTVDAALARCEIVAFAEVERFLDTPVKRYGGDP